MYLQKNKPYQQNVQGKTNTGNSIPKLRFYPSEYTHKCLWGCFTVVCKSRVSYMAVQEFFSTRATSPCTCETRSHLSAKRRVRHREPNRWSDLHELPASSGRKHLLNKTETGKEEYDLGSVLLNSFYILKLVYHPKAAHNWRIWTEETSDICKCSSSSKDLKLIIFILYASFIWKNSKQATMMLSANYSSCIGKDNLLMFGTNLNIL